MALWSGRFEQGVSEFTQEFGASLEDDKSMYAQDIAGSIAHAKMLGRQGVIPQEDAEKIEAGLQKIKGQVDAGTFAWDVNDEDIHMAVEGALIRDIGAPGARLHTGRSRNDQVATDIRLLAKDMLRELAKENCKLRKTLLSAAEKNFDVVMPGYTHMQHAQPVLFSHHLLAYFWMFTRDLKRISFAFEDADANPLGAAALAGTTYPLDRFYTTELLGFDHPIPNSMDAVSDRDYLLDLLFSCSVSMMHLSRLCEEIITWSTTEFGFITLSDEYSTGSSIMPQKKNPDVAELLRGKTGRVYGDLFSLLTVMKGIPLAYNKDMQEDKEPFFDARDTLLKSLPVFTAMLQTMTFREDVMERGAAGGFTNATDCADYLTKKGVPFRDAHRVVGELVNYCIKADTALMDLSLEELKSFHPAFEQDVFDAMSLKTCVDGRSIPGGPAPSAVQASIDEARKQLAQK